MSYSCPICSEKIVLINARMDLYKCFSCTHPTSILPPEKQEPYSENYFVETHKKWFDNPQLDLYDRVFNSLATMLKGRDLRIFDVGCGTGSFLKHLSKKGKNLDLTGVDLVENEYPGVKFMSGDFLKMDIKEEYDVTTNFMVIEHVTDPHLFVAKMREALVPDGLMVINTINSDSIVYRAGRFLDKLGFSTAHDRLYDPHHLQHFNNKSLIRLLEDEGMEIVEIKNHNYPLKAVDVPTKNAIMEKLYLTFVGAMFLLSKPLNMGHHQTIICKKK